MRSVLLLFWFKVPAVAWESLRSPTICEGLSRRGQQSRRKGATSAKDATTGEGDGDGDATRTRGIAVAWRRWRR